MMCPCLLAVLHGGAHDASARVLSQWTVAPGVVAGLALLTGAYTLGIVRLWASAGVGHGVRRAQAASFAAGVVAVVLALNSPLDALAAQLQWAHMIQHLLLIAVAPPLLLLGQPWRALVWALPAGKRSRILDAIETRFARVAAAATTPAVAFGLHAIALIVWHFPAPYDAALRHESIHALEHFSFLATAILFWWTVLAPPGLRRLNVALRVPFIGAMSLIGGAIGAVLTFASTPFYRAYAGTVQAWGFTPLEDQQVAGLVMWIPGGILYLAAAAIAFVRWLDRASPPDEAHHPVAGDLA